MSLLTITIKINLVFSFNLLSFFGGNFFFGRGSISLRRVVVSLQGPISIYIVKENPISKVVSEFLCYRHTDDSRSVIFM